MSQLNLPKKTDFSFYKNPAIIENSIIIAFILFGFVGILHHEIWRDEFQAWLLARDSASLIELFQNMRYEGHPGLWHLCLYGLSQITNNPLIMQVFHLFISSIIVCLIVKFSPFSPLHKFLLSFGYYTFYEYTIISRNYNLGVLFVFLFCILYSRDKIKPILLAILLALMANANVFAFILSIALSLTLVDYIYSQIQANKFSHNRQKIFISLFILFSGWGLSVLQIVRPLFSQLTVIRPLEPAAEQIQSGWNLVQELKLLAVAIINIWRSYVPIPLNFNDDFWNSNILLKNPVFPSIAGVSLGEMIAAFASFLLLLLAIYLLYKKRLFLTIYLFGTGSILVFNYLIFSGVMRHRGHLFILLVACFWLFKKELSKQHKIAPQQNKIDKFRNQFLTVILSLHLLAGIHAYSIDLFYPFSVGRETAQYIKENNLDDLTIISQRYRQAAVLSGYLDKQIYIPGTGEFSSFWKAETQMKDINIVEEVIRNNPDDTLLVLTYPLKSEPVFPADIQVTELKRFEQQTIEEFENSFYIYRVREIE
ncbi:MAG: hypothetical protein WBA13_05150 [Microcoleaceae cyanobacterium]